MFRCPTCGSGYSSLTASALDSCPRCLARTKEAVPRSFELGWRPPAGSRSFSASVGGVAGGPESKRERMEELHDVGEPA